MHKHRIDFNEVTFTESELDERERKMMILCIEIEFKYIRHTLNFLPDNAFYIKLWMDKHGIKHNELSFTSNQLAQTELWLVAG